ncbi:MAG: hypothetical protein WC052_05845 [Patescibacteria group bacterium]
MKYLVFRILTGGDMYVHSHVSFHDHLCHIDVAEANKPMVANAFSAPHSCVEVIGAGFIEFDAIGAPVCYGYSDSLNIHSRGKLDSEIIRASMLQLSEYNPNRLDEVFGQFDQCRRANEDILESLKDKEFVLTKRAGVLVPSNSIEMDMYANCIKPFNVVKFRNIVAVNGQTYFVFDVNGEDYLFKFGVLSTLIKHDQMTAVLVRDDDPYAPDKFLGITFTCNVPDYDIPKGAFCSLKEIVFEEFHDPDLVSVALGTVKLTVNNEERTIEMKLIDLCHMIHTGQEEE